MYRFSKSSRAASSEGNGPVAPAAGADDSFEAMLYTDARPEESYEGRNGFQVQAASGGINAADLGVDDRRVRRRHCADGADADPDVLPPHALHRHRLHTLARPALMQVAEAGTPDPHLAHSLRYVNPQDGGWAMPTIATWLTHVPKGFETKPMRSTDGHSVTGGARTMALFKRIAPRSSWR